MLERKPLTETYPKELTKFFPDLEKQIEAFLKEKGEITVSLETPVDVVRRCTEGLQSLAKTIAFGIKNCDLDPAALYLQTIQPVRKVGYIAPRGKEQVGLIALGNHRYHVLEKISGSVGRSLLMLLQRIPYGVDTGPEVHGITRNEAGELIPDKKGGIEIYLPLVNGITFYVNDQVYQPQALEGLITIFPGDNHHHVKEKGHRPARVLILGGCGFGKGIKIKSSEVSAFAEIPRFIPLS